VREERRPDTQAELANERTYLAWLRTGLALVAVGVAAERVLPAEGVIWARQLIGVSLILAGVLTAVWRGGVGRRSTVPCARDVRSPGRSSATWWRPPLSWTAWPRSCCCSAPTQGDRAALPAYLMAGFSACAVVHGRVGRRRLATTPATQPPASDRTGQHLLDDASDLSSEDVPRWDWADGFLPTRSRKVVGSNPTSGSKQPLRGHL
jgi:uncharacterized membrane protein YidH (DUF202 family)